jgi:3-hydroxyacyl-CoA dehydrogenase, NAD binding domain
MFALAGHPTILSDQQRAQADTALDRLHGLIERGIVRGCWNAEQARAARHNLSAVNGLEDYANRDLVIEARSGAIRTPIRRVPAAWDAPCRTRRRRPGREVGYGRAPKGSTTNASGWSPPETRSCAPEPSARALVLHGQARGAPVFPSTNCRGSRSLCRRLGYSPITRRGSTASIFPSSHLPQLL